MSDKFDQDAIDPELVARLASWFGEDMGLTTQRDTEEPSPDSERLQATLDAADPDLMDALERQGFRAADVLCLAEPPPPDDRPMAQFDAFVYEIDPHTERSEHFEQPRDIKYHVSEQNTPQAVLRDLHRPVLSFGDVRLRQRLDASRPAFIGPREATRAALDAHQALVLPPLASDLIREDRADLDELMARPWEDAKPEVTTERDVMRDSDAALWFGTMGGYDPDL